MKINDVPVLTIDEEIRFWSYVIRRGPDDCWDFIGRINSKSGHCRFDIRYSSFLVHRIAYKITHPIENISGILVCHDCDNPKCCNPNHLFKGTSKDNVRDSVIKGRHISITLLGQARPNSRLTELQIIEIRNRYSIGTETYSSLATIFKVDQSTIGNIVNRRQWKHI